MFLTGPVAGRTDVMGSEIWWNAAGEVEGWMQRIGSFLHGLSAV